MRSSVCMNRKNKIIICILLISFVQMSTNGVAAILFDIQTHFSNVPVSLVQLLMTFPSLFIIIFTMLSAYLLRYFSKKLLIELGLSLVCIAGIFSFVCYESLMCLFIGAALLGSGTGLCASFAISLISDFFQNQERQKIMGWQAAASNLGSMLMTFLGGLFALISWRYNYFVYFIAFPGLIATHYWLDDRKSEIKYTGSFNDLTYGIRISTLIIFFMIFFYTGPTSIALLLAEKGYTDTSLAGTGSTIFLLGGTICALGFGKLNEYLKQFCIEMGFLVLSIGLAIMGFSNSLLIYFVGCFIAGSSISFIMPKCMLLISLNTPKHTIALATALAMAASNVGTLIAPIFTVICDLFDQTLTSQRIYVSSYACIAFILFLIVSKFFGGKKNEK